MKIALLVIATNKYIKFTYPLWESVQKYFLKGHEVDMFVFTNQDEIPAGTKKVYQDHFPFPYPTLMRYHIFTKNKEHYKDYDAHFYCDADMLFLDHVGNEVLKDTVVTLHPGYYASPRQAYTYETRPESTAYVAPNEGSYYFAGGFNGGFKYLEVAEKITKMIDKDAERGLVAVWHDESYLNRYFIDNKPSLILDPSYCYPDTANPARAVAWKLTKLKPKLIALDKNHAEVRS
jgi:histo-blood group ABO system transferase